MFEAMIWLALAGLGVLVLCRFLLRVEREGMTDREYREYSRGGGRVGNAFLAVQAIFEPDRQHAVEERRSDRGEDVESGAPPRWIGD